MDKRSVIITYSLALLFIGALLMGSAGYNFYIYLTNLEEFVVHYFIVAFFEIGVAIVTFMFGVLGLLRVEIKVDTETHDEQEQFKINKKLNLRLTADIFFNYLHYITMIMFFIFIFQFFLECIILSTTDIKFILFLIFVIIGILTAAAQDIVYLSIKKGKIRKYPSEKKLLVYYGSSFYYMVVYAIAALNPLSLTAGVLFAILMMVLVCYVIYTLIKIIKSKGEVNDGNEQ